MLNDTGQRNSIRKRGKPCRRDGANTKAAFPKSLRRHTPHFRLPVNRLRYSATPNFLISAKLPHRYYARLSERGGKPFSAPKVRKSRRGASGRTVLETDRPTFARETAPAFFLPLAKETGGWGESFPPAGCGAEPRNLTTSSLLLLLRHHFPAPVGRDVLGLQSLSAAGAVLRARRLLIYARI